MHGLNRVIFRIWGWGRVDDAITITKSLISKKVIAVELLRLPAALADVKPYLIGPTSFETPIFKQSYARIDLRPAMAAVLGKRKRRDRLESPPHEIEDDPTYNIRLQRLLQQNFETRFEPLESLYQAPTQSTFLEEDDERTDDDECDWTGFSEASQEGGDPVVVHHQKREKTRADISKGDIKLFMVRRLRLFCFISGCGLLRSSSG